MEAISPAVMQDVMLAAKASGCTFEPYTVERVYFYPNRSPVRQIERLTRDVLIMKLRCRVMYRSPHRRVGPFTTQINVQSLGGLSHLIVLLSRYDMLVLPVEMIEAASRNGIYYMNADKGDLRQYYAPSGFRILSQVAQGARDIIQEYARESS